MPTNLVCHLLRLAPELRLTIYGHNFNDITMIHNPITSHFVTKNLANPPGILLASQQIHHVSIKLFYATATFSFECGIDAVHWMHTVPRAYLGVVTKVRYAMRDLGRLFLGRELDAILQRERYWSVREANKAGVVLSGDVEVLAIVRVMRCSRTEMQSLGGIVKATGTLGDGR